MGRIDDWNGETINQTFCSRKLSLGLSFFCTCQKIPPSRAGSSSKAKAPSRDQMSEQAQIRYYMLSRTESSHYTKSTWMQAKVTLDIYGHSEAPYHALLVRQGRSWSSEWLIL